MTVDETLKLIKKDINKARKLEQSQNDIQSEIFNLLDQLHIDINMPSEAENADKLEDAITCYIGYGEFTISKIMEEIKQQLI